jgi:hypothetical protein
MTMFAASTSLIRRSILTVSAVAAVTALVLLAASGQALPSADAKRPTAPVPPARENYAANAPNAEQPPAKIVAEPPKPELLAQGVAIVQFRTENVQIVPVFGPAAAKVSPRLGHLHVTLDDAPWHWAHTSNDPVIVAPLAPGPHKILLELADADHKVLAKEVVNFDVPRR